MLSLQRNGSFMETRINEWNMFWACSQKQTSPSCKTGNLQSAPLPRHSLVSVFTKNIKTLSLCFTMFSPWQGKRRHITRFMEVLTVLRKVPGTKLHSSHWSCRRCARRAHPTVRLSTHPHPAFRSLNRRTGGTGANFTEKLGSNTCSSVTDGSGGNGAAQGGRKVQPETGAPACCSPRRAQAGGGAVPAVGKEGKGRAAVSSPYLRAAPPGRRPSRPAPGPAAAAPPCPARPRAPSPARGSARPPRTQGLSLH